MSSNTSRTAVKNLCVSRNSLYYNNLILKKTHRHIKRPYSLYTTRKNTYFIYFICVYYL